MRPDGSGAHPIPITGTPSDDLAHPSWSPDGSRLGFDVFITGVGPGGTDRVEPWAVDLDGSNPRRLASCDLPCLQLAYPEWSPDGSEVALIRYDVRDDGTWGPSALEVLDLSTGTRRVLAETADGTTAYYYPRWSHAGDSILVAVETYTDEEQGTVTDYYLALVAVTDGGTPARLTPAGVLAREAAWDPSGARIVATLVDAIPANMDRASLALVTVSDGSSEPIDLGVDPGSAGAYHPSWAGDEILFVIVGPDYRDGRIASIRPDGSNLEVLPASAQLRSHPRLRPLP